MPPLLSLQVTARTTKGLVITSQQLNRHVPLQNIWALQAFATHLQCLPRKPITLLSSVSLF